MVTSFTVKNLAYFRPFLQVMSLTDNIQLILDVMRSSTVVEVQVFILYMVCGLFRLLISTSTGQKKWLIMY